MARPRKRRPDPRCLYSAQPGPFIEHVTETAGQRPSAVTSAQSVARRIDPQTSSTSPGSMALPRRPLPASVHQRSSRRGCTRREGLPGTKSTTSFPSAPMVGDISSGSRRSRWMDIAARWRNRPEGGQGAGLGRTSRVVGPAVAQVRLVVNSARVGGRRGCCAYSAQQLRLVRERPTWPRFEAVALM